MRKPVIVALSSCLLALLTAGTASATVSYDPATQSGFIGRGDVIAAGGKGALIADPFVLFTNTTSYALTCTWPDQTQRTVNIERQSFVLFRASTRYASGTGTITGYTFSRDNIVDGGSSPPASDSDICWTLLGTASTGTAVGLSYANVSHAEALTFFGPNAISLAYS